METAMTCKYMYHVIAMLIGLYTIMPVFWILLNVAKPWIPFLYLTETHGSYKHLVQLIIGILEYLLDLAINSLLLFLYVKALHVFSNCFYRANTVGKLLDDRQHELMLEAARYTVVFSVAFCFNLLGLVVLVIGAYIREQLLDTSFGYICSSFGMFFLLGKDVFLLMAIKLSFIFSHSKYEKVFTKCDESVKNYCQDLVAKRKEDKLRENSRMRHTYTSKRRENDLTEPFLNSSINGIQMSEIDTFNSSSL